MTLIDTILRRTEERHDEPAIFWEDHVVSYRELAARSARLAAGLRQRGVRHGDRVAVGLPNGPELVSMVMAVLRSGAVLVPLNPASSAEEARYVIDDSGALLVVTHEEQARAVAGAGCPPVVTDLAELGRVPSDCPAISAEDPALIIYTSGTSGRPKGAVLSQRALLSNFTTVAASWEWTASDRLLLTLPCFHLHGLGLGVLGSLLVGSSIVLRPRFAAEEALDLLARFECTMFFGVPTMYNRLVQLPDAGAARARLGRMRVWVSGSAPLTASTHLRFRELFGYALMDRYGMTEACFVLSTPYREARRPGVVGRPLPGIDVQLVDPEAADEGRVEPVVGESPGELVFRGPNLFSGYWGRPLETRQSFLAGYLRSGDLAVREPDGMYRILGRRSVDIIKSRGFKISAVEIENCLQQHPEVAEVAVVGIPDADRGEAVVAAITPVPGCSLREDELRRFARRHLAPHKVPARFVSFDEIPRTGPGKFKKRELIDLLVRGERPG